MAKEEKTEPDRVIIHLNGMSVDIITEEVFLGWKDITGATKAVVFQKMVIFCHFSKDFDVRTAAKEWEDVV